jgi:Flp pilus assembly protein TadD
MTPPPITSPTALSLRRRLMRGAVLAPTLAVLLLAGCAKPKDATDPTMTGSIQAPLTSDDFSKALDYWAKRYQTGEKDRDVGLNYAAALRRMGRNDQALAVLQKTIIYFPDDREVQAAYGKALAANGDLQQALATIERAQTPDQPDWRLISAKAAILDQVGQNGEARQLYAKALELAPNEPSVLSNYGMSYVLTGDLAQAEKLLRRAIAAPGADSRVRQNLALVVGLQGRFDEARKIASEDLSPDQAAANIAYLKSMLADQPNTWQKLKSKDAG